MVDCDLLTIELLVLVPARAFDLLPQQDDGRVTTVGYDKVVFLDEDYGPSAAT